MTNVICYYSVFILFYCLLRVHPIFSLIICFMCTYRRLTEHRIQKSLARKTLYDNIYADIGEAASEESAEALRREVRKKGGKKEEGGGDRGPQGALGQAGGQAGGQGGRQAGRQASGRAGR